MSNASSESRPYGALEWKTLWIAQGMPWRREPEVDISRMQFLDERRAIASDIKAGVYPFQGVRLTRADIEYLLATHEKGRGPVDWLDGIQRRRAGLDLRGAELRGTTDQPVDLSGLPLARTQFGLYYDDWLTATPEERTNAAAQMTGVSLQLAHVEGASFRSAHLEGSDLRSAYLEGAGMTGAYLGGFEMAQSLDVADRGNDVMRRTVEPAMLDLAFFSPATQLNDVVLGDSKLGCVSVADVRWGGVNLAVIDWSRIDVLGDERKARRSFPSRTIRKTRAQRIAEYEAAARAYRQLSGVLHDQGISEPATRFAYRAQVCQRAVLRLQGTRKWFSYVGSLMLDVLAGYGYRPARSFLVYLGAIVWFANIYHWFGLAPLDAVVFSMASFHGRGFFPSEAFTLHSPVAIAAAIEAFFGLLVEITFIATFTQRFLGR